MGIDPDIIPENSKEGDEAIQLPKINLFIPIALCLLILSILFLKALFSTLLIFLGINFIWKQATKKLD